jgi:hypothetical protein
MAILLPELGDGLLIVGLTLIVLVWVWLVVKLVRWWREGRKWSYATFHVRPRAIADGVLWPYPLLWAFGMTLPFLFALALLIPRFRRDATPKPANGFENEGMITEDSN